MFEILVLVCLARRGGAKERKSKETVNERLMCIRTPRGRGRGGSAIWMLV